jgi:hypothetical protein
MDFALALAIAMNFWAVRGVEVPCHPVAVSGAHLQLDEQYAGWYRRYGIRVEIPMASDVAKCQILISRTGVISRRLLPEEYCADVTHEVGHIAGLSHAATGPMAEPPDSPWYCQEWRVFKKRYRAVS